MPCAKEHLIAGLAVGAAVNGLIQWLECLDAPNKRFDFYVHAGGRTVWVIIATSAYGHKYLKTQADGEHPDNLLSLPECP